MDKKRKVYAPFSLTSEAGVAQTPVEGYIDVNQTIYPSVSTGTINENGTWTGVKSDDEEFFGFTKAEQVDGGTTFLTPDTGTVNFIDMSGFRHLQIAVLCNRSINIKLEALMGPDTNRFANLSPVAPAALLKFVDGATGQTNFDNVLRDTSEAISSVGWNLFTVMNRMQGQKMMQIRVGNEDASAANFEVAFRRLV
tara:strand:+ start:105 stop:692 length:588 start_codon:yes stop_codon:yes gene_type:complete